MPLWLQPVELKHVRFPPWEPLQDATLAARQRIDQDGGHGGCSIDLNSHESNASSGNQQRSEVFANAQITRASKMRLKSLNQK